MHEASSNKYDEQPVGVRFKISSLWISMLFVFAYVDLFSLYRPDFRTEVEAGEIAGFAINQTFLFLTTLYIIIPSLMVFLTLILRPGPNRIANTVLSVLYLITIVGSAIGEWSYFVLGSAVEAALLGLVVYYAWNWPRPNPGPSPSHLNVQPFEAVQGVVSSPD